MYRHVTFFFMYWNTHKTHLGFCWACLKGAITLTFLGSVLCVAFAFQQSTTLHQLNSKWQFFLPAEKSCYILMLILYLLLWTTTTNIEQQRIVHEKLTLSSISPPIYPSTHLSKEKIHTKNIATKTATVSTYNPFLTSFKPRKGEYKNECM